MQNTMLRITEDGSHTLFAEETGECYHSTKGAIQESMHIFIRAGFRQCTKSHIRILEIGFGTGLNAFLTLLENSSESDVEVFIQNAKNVEYTAVELYPVESEIALQLNYPELTNQNSRQDFEKLHQAAWNEPVKITENFTLTKLKCDFTVAELNDTFDLIYFDAFSPEKQPEMWSEEMFRKLYISSAENAILTTYCAKGAVRRAMQAAGFRVERLPGPPGKREIIRARKIIT